MYIKHFLEDHKHRIYITLFLFFMKALMVYKYMDEILPQWVIVSKKQFSRGILGIEFINQYLHVVTALGILYTFWNTISQLISPTSLPFHPSLLTVTSHYKILDQY